MPSHSCRKAASILTRSRTFLVLLAAFWAVSIAQAQYRASIQGVITDQEGAVIPGANVTLTNLGTNKVLKSVADASGNYNFNALAPDNYSIVVEKEGFTKKVLDSVKLIPEQANAINIQLAIGQSSQTVTVSGDQLPALDTASASISGTIGSNEIQHLPAFGRDVFQLAQLAPGVFGNGAQASGGGTANLPGTQIGGSGSTEGIFKTENGPQITGNGGQTNANGITVDGISTASAVWGGTSVITPSADSVGDMKIVANSYDAENGRFSGAQIQVTTKAGSNDVHGSLFFKASRPGLNAYQRWNGPNSEVAGTPADRGLNRDTGRFNQFGGSIGGPIWKNRIFAFFNYETLRNNTVTTDQDWYEAPQLLTSAPAGSIANQLLTFPGEGAAFNAVLAKTCTDIGLIEGTQCRTIPGQGLDVGSPLTSPLGTHDPTWVSNGTPGVGSGLDGIPDIAYVNTLNPNNVTETQYNGRLDADATSRDRLTFTIYWVPASVTNYQGTTRSANLWHHEAINDAFAGLWNHTFSPTLLNEARVNAAGWRWNEIATNPQEPFGLPQENFGTPGAGQSIGSANLQAFGAPGPSVFNQWTYSYQDILTKIAGRHSLKFGGQLTRLYYLNEATYSARPSYNFVNLWDFLNDAPYAETGTFNPLTGETTSNRQDNRSNLWGAFVQDDFKVRQNLTINLGLRWSYFGPLSSKGNNLSVAQFGTGANTFTDLSLRVGGNLYEAQKLNFGPQVGFAWSPAAYNSKLVLRGGFGLSYNQNEIAITSNGTNNPPNVVGVSYCCSSFDNPQSTIVYGVPSDPKSLYGYPANPNAITPFGPNNLPLTGGTISIAGYQSHPPTAYTYHYSLDTQLDLGHQWVLTVGTQGSNGRHLLLQNNLNVLGIAAGAPLNPKVQQINYYQNTGNSSYNALLTGLKHQFSSQFLLDAQFTWAKSMDNGSQPYYEDPYPYNSRASWGRSDFNVGNAFKLYGLWQPVIFRGSNNWLEKVVGGWSISGIFNLHGGFPWTPLYTNTGGNLFYQGSGYGTLRPAAYLGGAGNKKSNSAFKSGPGDVRSGANENFSRGALSYFTVPQFTPGPAFPEAGALPQGSLVSRNSFNSPGYNDVDATLTKAFGLPKFAVLGENAKIEIRADAFNVFNKLNIQGGGQSNGGSIIDTISNDGVTSNPNFGQAQKALGSRTVQLQARFSF